MKKFIAILLSTALLTSAALAKDKDKKDDDPAAIYAGIEFRAIGPAVTSGRITDFAMIPGSPHKFYAATASGGLWYTANNGQIWTPVFDSYGSYSIGDVEVDPNDAAVIWVGTGENNSQRSVGYGDGVYKSIDGGKSFKNVGLKDSQHIGKII
ncbi:MAG: glycosyl hydrolase, partial [Proteobacteria bacterium]|nr:glycosyl hydrolase [Pseudomonadota bacterium]